jgi:hypothetical protein
MRNEPLREDVRRYREGRVVQILPSLRRLTINSIRLDGIWSNNENMATLVYYHIKGLAWLLG